MNRFGKVHTIAAMNDSSIGTSGRPLRAAVFGSGPSGFYAAEELLSRPDIAATVDMFDRLPTPYGLVRGGVAPDHPKIKSVARVFEKTAARPGFRFFGNVEFGRDVSLEDVRGLYDAAIFATGAASDRKMGIPGEDLSGSFPATEFVGWYNGHPDFRELRFDLSCERAAVIGIGNVAIDVARILARDPDSLKDTDISAHALAALRESKIREIFLIGRRGPAQAAFTNPEIRELRDLPGAGLVAAPEEIELDPLSRAALESGGEARQAKENLRVLAEHSRLPPKGRPKNITLLFLRSPAEGLGNEGKVSALKLEKNELFKDKDGSLRPKGTGRFETLPVGLVFRSVGYKGLPLAGLPYDKRKGVLPNKAGRLLDLVTGKILPGLYAAGWAKRGPSGVIGTNKPDSIETAANLLADFSGKTGGPDKSPGAVLERLQSRKVPYVTFEDWKKLDRMETERGQSAGKIREKFTRVPEMLKALGLPPSGS